MAPPPRPYSGTSTLALVARVSGFSFGLVYGSMKLKYLKADIQNLKDAICSAVDVMQAMASSICSLLIKVEHLNSLASELASVTTNDRAWLDRCRDLLSTLTAMQVTMEF